ncbi:MAG: acetate--CoA ligase family protein, partial [bacterium]
KICKENNIALVGPNCLGVINPEIHMNASFSTVMPEVGPLAFITQSGALGTAILDYTQKLNIGFSKFISLGNKTLVNEADVLEYLSKDKATKAIAIYTEELSDPQAIIKLSKKMACGRNPKAIFVLKAGRTSAGAKASASHTGAIAGSDAAYDALFHQSGIIRVSGNTELFEYARCFAHNKLQTGNKVAIVTNAGGPGVLAADEAAANGLELAHLSKQTTVALQKILPQFAAIKNPIDMLGDAKADRYRNTLKTLIKDKNVDGILAILTPQSMTEIEKTAQVLIDIKAKTEKPIIASFIGGPMVSASVQMMQKNKVATANFPEQGAKALTALFKFNAHCRIKKDKIAIFNDIDKKKVKTLLAIAKASGKKELPEYDATEILRAYNFPVLQNVLAKNVDEVRKIIKNFGNPMAMKIVSDDILHKSDVGGVALNVTTYNLRPKYNKMMRTVKQNAPEAKIDGVLMQEMVAESGIEMILGNNKEATLGNVVMVGLGGVYVEVFKDVAFGIAPITKYNARDMVQQLKSAKILNGARGGKKMDVGALIEYLGRLSQLVTDFPEIKELDINPLLILLDGRGAKVLDARISI